MKIVSLVPSYTEIVFSLGLGSALAGVTEHCDFPPRAKNIAKVGTFARPDVEKVVSLQPDLVCAGPELHKNCIDKLVTCGIKVYSPSLQKVDDVLASMQYLAEICNRKEALTEVVAPLLDRLNKIKDKTINKYRPRVFRVMSTDPVITPGPLSVQYDAIEVAGGTLMPMEDRAYLEISRAELADFDPEILLVCGRREGEPGRPRCKGCLSKDPVCQKTVQEIIPGNWAGITAVKHNNIFPLSCDMLCRPGARLIDGIEKLNKYFITLK